MAPDLDLSGLVLAAPGVMSGMLRRAAAGAFARLLRFVAPHSEITVERLSGWELTPAAAIRLLSDPLVLRGVRPAMLFGLFKLARNTLDRAADMRVPALTMVGSREDVVSTHCIAQLHERLAGAKDWASFEDGPHLLLDWQFGDAVLERALGWMEDRLAPANVVPFTARKSSLP